MIHEERAKGPPVVAAVGAMPVGRIGRREEIADLMEWLASLAAGFFSGTHILMVGGMVAASRRSQMRTEGPQNASHQTPPRY